MNSLPYTILSSAISVDGFLDDTSSERLILSHPEDLDRVDALRASCDGILVGANTIRTDNPGLRIRSHVLLQQRVDAGKPEHLIKATLTASGNLPASAKFFASSDNATYVYCTPEAFANLADSIRTRALVLESPPPLSLEHLLADLKTRGVDRLLVEGGRHIATSLLSQNLVDEFRLAVAPFFLGQHDAPRFVGSAVFPYDKSNRMHLLSTESVGDMAVMTYKLKTL